MATTNVQNKAIEAADAELKNAGLPTFSDMVAAMKRIANLTGKQQHAGEHWKIADEMIEQFAEE